MDHTRKRQRIALLLVVVSMFAAPMARAVVDAPHRNPMRPEYPCAHCISSSVVGAMFKAEIDAGPTPTLTTTSHANGATRSWTKIEDFTQEVSNARIYDGVHYRSSTEVGAAMGERIGDLAAAKFLRRE